MKTNVAASVPSLASFFLPKRKWHQNCNHFSRTTTITYVHLYFGLVPTGW